MSKHEDFMEVINTLKTLSPTITDAQRRGLLHRAVREFDLSIEEADEILKSSGLIVGDSVNYFQVLGLSLEELQDQSEDAITTRVDAAHQKYYSDSLRAGGLPRPDGRTQEQWRTVLNQARDTLKDPQKRAEHIASLQVERIELVKSIQTEEFPDVEPDELPHTDETSISIAVPEDMVLIPAGEFQMGSSSEKANDREKPEHTVYVDAFCMDKYPVTNAQYKKFLASNPQWWKRTKRNRWNNAINNIRSIPRRFHDGDYLKEWDMLNFPTGKDDHPVTHISWYAAMAYAEWIGKRLPTEAEWEKAARGGKTGQKYPWGNSLDSKMAYIGKTVGKTTPVGIYPANNYELYDIVGNTWEWCLDTFDANFYDFSPHQNPIAGVNTVEDLNLLISNFWDVKSDRVLRGGTVFTSLDPFHTAARWGCAPNITNFRTSLYASKFVANIGFRCVWDTRYKS